MLLPMPMMGDTLFGELECCGGLVVLVLTDDLLTLAVARSGYRAEAQLDAAAVSALRVLLEDAERRMREGGRC